MASTPCTWGFTCDRDEWRGQKRGADSERGYSTIRGDEAEALEAADSPYESLGADFIYTLIVFLFKVRRGVITPPMELTVLTPFYSKFVHSKGSHNCVKNTARHQ